VCERLTIFAHHAVNRSFNLLENLETAAVTLETTYVYTDVRSAIRFLEFAYQDSMQDDLI